MAFHEREVGRTRSALQNRIDKEGRVREGRTHPALVFDGPTAIGWCQFGPTNELPSIKHKREYLDGLTSLLDWRITCLFVDRDFRGKGVASIALEGDLNEIARLIGGIVESYPEYVEGRSISGSFLHNVTLSLFESQGFQRTRRLGENRWVVTKVIESLT